ncbi:MAG TPA: TonB-dependent receptor [Candidatus Dormibacteraeota bacterium]|nr:TonB-dependent receptor [Candidatus Dormibacteraeota bacterium]
MAAFGAPLSAQGKPDTQAAPNLPDQPAALPLTGVIRTAGGGALPGATLRVIQTSTGKAWVSWTDENGKFEFPALPAAHYRVEISQLGFAPATREIDLTANSQTPFEWKLDVATLAEMAAPAASESAAKSPSPATPAASETAKARTSGAPAVTPGAPASAVQNAAAADRGARPSQPRRFPGGNAGRPGNGPGGFGAGGGRRAFQQVGLSDQNLNNPNDIDTMAEEENPNDAADALGQAASADAVQMIGTVAMGQTQNQMGGFPQIGGAPDAQDGSGNTIPGQAAPEEGPMRGGFRGGGRGGLGGGRGRGPGRRGPQGVAALWGAQRLLRQRINRVHYSVYSRYGNSALNARPYSLTQINPPKISSWTESAGFNMGGPLKIPHVYDGTDKTFFFVNFGGTWSRNPVDSFATVPTAAERAGDFSGDNVPLYDPASNLTGPRTLMSNSGCAQDAANAAGTCIPQSRISLQSLSLLNYIPLPNLPGRTLNYHLQTNLPGLSNRLNVHVTHQISSNLSLQVNYHLSNGTSHALSSFPGIEGNTFTRGQSAVIRLTQNLTKAFLHTSEFYFSRSRSLGLNQFSNLTDISGQLGITGVSTAPFDFGLPQINFTNFTGLSDPTPSLDRSQTYRYVDSVRWMLPKHTITFGGEIRKMDMNRNTDPAPNGRFAFTGLMTSQLTSAGAPDPSIASGNDFADFLLGYPANTRVQFGNTSTYFRNWGFVAYASDDWHMFPRFTLTYGARYEAFTPPTEINGHIANLNVSSDFSQVQCVTPVATAGCVAGTSASLFNGHYNNWAPRIGIAWQPPGKWFSGQHQMTVRAGYSMFYVESYLNTLASAMANQPPFAVANTQTTLSGATPTLLTLQNGFPAVSADTLTNTVAVNPNYQVPYAMIWNASIEYNLLPDTFLEVMYTGTRGVHLDELLGFGLTNNAGGNSTGFTYDTSGAYSNFNALQVRLQKRMSHGLMFMARYTYSKSLDNASTIGGGGQTVIQNNADPGGDYGLSSFDMRHQFLGMFFYQLPFGERQRFATKGWEKAVFGNWRINASITAHSGTPYTVRVFSKNPACQNVPGVNSERADQIGPAGLANPTVQQWFNTAAFAAPAGCYGTAPRNSVIGPGAFTINSGLSKTIPFGRDGLRRIDFRWTASNLLNHVNYSGLSTVLGSTTFGQITGAGAMRSMEFTTRVNF